MKIEIWSDLSCPFCYIGKKLLNMAIEDLPFRENIYIKLKSYELDPKAEKNVSYDIYESLANKYNITVEEAKKMNDQIKKQGAEVGLQLNFDRIKQTNTFD